MLFPSVTPSSVPYTLQLLYFCNVYLEDFNLPIQAKGTFFVILHSVRLKVGFILHIPNRFIV